LLSVRRSSRTPPVAACCNAPTWSACTIRSDPATCWQYGGSTGWGVAAHRIELIGELEAERIGFQSVTESIDTTTPGGKLVFQIFGALAKFVLTSPGSGSAEDSFRRFGRSDRRAQRMALLVELSSKETLFSSSVPQTIWAPRRPGRIMKTDSNINAGRTAAIPAFRIVGEHSLRIIANWA